MGAGIQTESADSGAGNEVNSQVLALHYTSPGKVLRGGHKCGEMGANQIEEKKHYRTDFDAYDAIKDNQPRGYSKQAGNIITKVEEKLFIYLYYTFSYVCSVALL